MPFRKAKINRPRVDLSNKKSRANPNLKAFLKKNQISFEFLEKKFTRHAVEASEATGVPLASFAKTLVFVNEQGKPFVAVLRGDLDVNRHLLQKATGFKAVKIAPVQIAEKMTGFPTGGIPPIGHRRPMPVFVDKSLLELKEVWCGGGTRSRLVKLRVKDILSLTKAKIAPFAAAKK